MCSSGLRGRRRLKPVKLDKRELFFASCEAKMRPWAAQGVNRGGTVTPQKSAAAPHFASGHFALEPTTIDALSDAMRAPPSSNKGGFTWGTADNFKRPKSLEIVGSAAAASKSTQDELRASRGLLREATGPGTGAGP